MRKVILITITLLAFISISFCNTIDDKAYVKNKIKETTDKVLKILKQKNLSEKEKKDKIFKIVNPLFDFNIMARLTLPKSVWKKMTPDQKKKFIELFKKRIRMVYLDRVTLKDVKADFKEPIQKSKRIIFVPAVFSSEGKDYSTVFKLWKSPKGWKIYDVDVEGVSIVRTYRSQFNEILKKGTIEDLLKKLETGKVKEVK